MEQIILGEIGNWDNDNMNSKENLEKESYVLLIASEFQL